MLSCDPIKVVSCSSYPKYELIRVIGKLNSISIKNKPSLSVIPPLFSPLILTLAASMGSPEKASISFPLIFV